MVKFDPNCYYSFGDGHVDNKDWNKLCGWSTDIFKRNSLRIGWRPHLTDKSCVELCSYVHSDGKRILPPKGQSWNLGKYKWGDWIYITIYHDRDDGVAIFSAKRTNDNNVKIVSVDYDKCVCSGYINNIYFGGNQSCPHDMTIELLEVN